MTDLLEALDERLTGDRLLTVEDLADVLHESRRSIHELTRLRAIPHLVRPHGRRCLFVPSHIVAWLMTDCELEIEELPGNGRCVRPRGDGVR